MSVTRWLGGACLLACTAVGSTGASPAGLWMVVGDSSGTAEALVRIVEIGSEFRGTVERVFSPPADSVDPRCEQCTGDRKDKPVIGMTILWGLRQTGAANEYGAGTILDPDNGTLYRCKATLREQGRKLEVRGYFGVSLFGRTQIWIRVE